MPGLLKPDAGHVNTGNVTYNGCTKDFKAFSLPKVAHFVEQVSETNVCLPHMSQKVMDV